MAAVAELKRLGGTYNIDGAFEKRTSGASHDRPNQTPPDWPL